MKDSLDPVSRKELIAYRLEKSKQAMRQAEIMAEHEMYDNAVTRLYYACFYVASALMIKNHIECGSHRGIKTMLALKFVKTGLLDPKFVRIFSELLNGRQLSDYEDFFYQNQESYIKYKEDANEFIRTLSKMIEA